MYKEQPIVYWPPAQDPDKEDKELDEVYRLLNPPSHLGNVHGTADERSLVYSTGSGDKPQALVFVGFDPAMKLAGLKTWGGLCGKGVGEGPHIDGRATGYKGDAQWEIGERNRYLDVSEADRTVTMDRKGKGKQKGTPVLQTCGDAKLQVETGFAKEEGARCHIRSWAWVEKAMYRDIGSGFHFGLPHQKA